jgi:hypothetical protein
MFSLLLFSLYKLKSDVAKQFSIIEVLKKKINYMNCSPGEFTNKIHLRTVVRTIAKAKNSATHKLGLLS